MPGLIALFTGAVMGTARSWFKLALLVSFIIAMVTFGSWFYSITSDWYAKIMSFTSSADLGTHADLLGCVISSLGLDVFFNSAFAIFYTGLQFWMIAVGYIVTYRLGLKTYDGVFKAIS